MLNNLFGVKLISKTIINIQCSFYQMLFYEVTVTNRYDY